MMATFKNASSAENTEISHILRQVLIYIVHHLRYLVLHDLEFTTPYNYIGMRVRVDYIVTNFMEKVGVQGPLDPL